MGQRLVDIFQQIKGSLYKREVPEHELRELRLLIAKRPKSAEERATLSAAFGLISTLRTTCGQLGSRVFKIEIDSIKNKSAAPVIYDVVDLKIRDLMRVLDTFIDTVSRFFEIIDYKEETFALKKSVAYLKGTREYLIKRTNEYTKQIIKNERDKEGIKLVLNDAIDVFLQESTSLQVLRFYELLEDYK